MKKKNVKTKNPNNKVGKVVAILVVVAAIGVGFYFGNKYYEHQKNLKSGMFDAIVDAIAPTVVATVGENNAENTGKEVSFQINDNEGGSALYGFCISEEPDIDAALDNDIECFETFLLDSNISYNLTLEIPFGDTPTMYYAYANDNFGNVSAPVEFRIQK